jgi:hypothetical protein
MNIPNCVPEYYRSREEESDRRYEKHMEQMEKVEGQRVIGEYQVLMVCDEHNCKNYSCVSPMYPGYEEASYYCKLDKCVHENQRWTFVNHLKRIIRR